MSRITCPLTDARVRALRAQASRRDADPLL